MSNKCETETEIECQGPCRKTKPLSEFVDGMNLCKECKIKLSMGNKK